MNKEKELNLTGGWEEIVNDVERHNARVRFDAKVAKRRRNRMIGRSVDFALGTVVCIALGAANLLVDWLAVPGAVVCLCIAAVITGRVFEQSRRGK